jgi:hypothetical protein
MLVLFILLFAGIQRGGNRGDQVTGARQALGGPGMTKSCTSNGGPGRPNHALQKGPEKRYMAMTRLYSSCSFGQLMIGTRPYLCCRFGLKGPKGLGKGPWQV